jgi:hypothetical protein
MVLHQKYLDVQAPTATMNKTPALKVPLQTELRFHSRRNEQPPHIGGPAGRQNPWWLADARSGSSDNDLRSEGPSTLAASHRREDEANHQQQGPLDHPS